MGDDCDGGSCGGVCVISVDVCGGDVGGRSWVSVLVSVLVMMAEVIGVGGVGRSDRCFVGGSDGL